MTKGTRGRDSILRRLEACVSTGDDLDLSDGKPIGWDEMDGWGNERAVEGSEIRRLMLDPTIKRNARGVRLRGALITGGLNLSYSTLDACLFLVSCRIEGEINMIQTELPLFVLRGSLIDRLTGDRMKVGGGVLFDYDPKSGGRGFKATGLVRMMGAEVGWFSLEGATLAYRGRNTERTRGEYDSRLTGRADDDACLRADGMKISERLTLVGVTASAEVRFPRTKVGTLILDEEIARHPRRQFVISDLRYTELEGAPRHSVTAGLRWLNCQTDRNMSSQPYRMLAEFYDQIGEDRRARFVRFRSAARQVFKRLPEAGDPHRARILAQNLLQVLTMRFWYGAIAGFGYYALFSAFWLLLSISVVYAVALGSRDDFLPTRAPVVAAASSAHPARSDACEKTYPCFSPVRYAVDAVVPFISIGQEDYWRPDEAEISRPARVAILLFKCFGWLSATLTVAGITGLLRKT